MKHSLHPLTPEASNRSVVILEDDHQWQVILRDLVAAEGCRSHVAGSPADALALLDEMRCPLAIVDMSLPGHAEAATTVIATLNAIRSETKVIVLTGRPDAGSIPLMESSRVIGVVAKATMDVGSFRSLLRRALDDSAASSTSSTQ